MTKWCFSIELRQAPVMKVYSVALDGVASGDVTIYIAINP
jgi:hypothetical protein